MSIFSAECKSYEEAIKLIEVLKEAGISANISTGGVGIGATDYQIDQARKICTAHGAHFTCGYTQIQEATLFRIGEAEEIQKAKGDAISQVQEWKE